MIWLQELYMWRFCTTICCQTVVVDGISPWNWCCGYIRTLPKNTFTQLITARRSGEFSTSVTVILAIKGLLVFDVFNHTQWFPLLLLRLVITLRSITEFPVKELISLWLPIVMVVHRQKQVNKVIHLIMRNTNWKTN